MRTVSQQFVIHYGNKKLHNKENLDNGKTLVVSSSGENSGFYGFFDTPATIRPPVVSVPSTGSVGEAFVQLHPCSIDDNCLVLYPRKPFDTEYLFYIANEVRRAKWRFMYGRQITPYRLGKLIVMSEDEFDPTNSWVGMVHRLKPKKNSVNQIVWKESTLKEFKITELFHLQRGHFHAINRLQNGSYPTISRIGDDNGIVGFYSKPKKAGVFPKQLITVSTVTGDAFLQYYPFIATDNVVICIPKRELRVTTLLYIQAVLNKVKWRYSYGRQCYKGVFQKTMLSLPINSKGEIAEDYIEMIARNQPYWNDLSEKLLNN
jgi:hypothetical protein